jgi:hypothetical protein
MYNFLRMNLSLLPYKPLSDPDTQSSHIKSIRKHELLITYVPDKCII